MNDAIANVRFSWETGKVVGGDGYDRLIANNEEPEFSDNLLEESLAVSFCLDEIDDSSVGIIELANGAMLDWLDGEIDTGTYQDILEYSGVADPEKHISSVECLFLV